MNRSSGDGSPDFTLSREVIERVPDLSQQVPNRTSLFRKETTARCCGFCSVVFVLPVCLVSFFDSLRYLEGFLVRLLGQNRISMNVFGVLSCDFHGLQTWKLGGFLVICGSLPGSVAHARRREAGDHEKMRRVENQ